MSVLPSPEKSPLPKRAAPFQPVPMLWDTPVTQPPAPLPLTMYSVPSDLRHRTSGLPSPVKSPGENRIWAVAQLPVFSDSGPLRNPPAPSPRTTRRLESPSRRNTTSGWPSPERSPGLNTVPSVSHTAGGCEKALAMPPVPLPAYARTVCRTPGGPVQLYWNFATSAVPEIVKVMGWPGPGMVPEVIVGAGGTEVSTQNWHQPDHGPVMLYGAGSVARTR